MIIFTSVFLKIKAIKQHIKYHAITLLLALFVLNNSYVLAQFYNGTNTGFGKNRVQFKNYEWKYYRFDKYETYFYTGGNELAVYTSKIAPKLIEDQEEFFDFDLKEKIQFILTGFGLGFRI